MRAARGWPLRLVVMLDKELSMLRTHVVFGLGDGRDEAYSDGAAGEELILVEGLSVGERGGSKLALCLRRGIEVDLGWHLDSCMVMVGREEYGGCVVRWEVCERGTSVRDGTNLLGLGAKRLGHSSTKVCLSINIGAQSGSPF